MPIKPVAQNSKRLPPRARAEMILEEAIRFFAEKGFSAQITELAARLGISHGLIFRYFGTKQRLIDLVYHRVYVSRWSDKWVQDLADRSVPLKQRIEHFYLAYLEAVDTPEWVRIALYAGLAGEHLPRGRAVRKRVEQALSTILRELRVYRRLPEEGPFDPMEWELACHLHSSVVYLLLRKYVLDHGPFADDRAATIRTIVHNFFCEFEKDAVGAAAMQRAPRQPPPAKSGQGSVVRLSVVKRR